jgi:signal transduction histidine kinase
MIRDIQDRIEAELEREKLLQDIAYSRDQIEQEAARYVELNVQLAESEKKLIELNSAKDKLFSIIGHDLKNPIFTILGFSQILEEDYEEMTDEKKLEYIKTIYQTAASIQKLLENLLTWSRAQTGRLEVNLEPISIRNVINETVDIVTTQAEKKNIEIIVNLNSTLMVYADNNLLETVVRNLLTNAIKFTNPGGRITVSTRDENGFVAVSVEDTGIGLSEADKNKLFRIDVNNAEIGHHKEKGTGLGLILCKEFCEKMGGSIWVESKLGKGSAFYFTVPIFQYINK